MSAIAIRAEGLTKDYRAGFWRRRVRVLQDLNLQIQIGEVFGFLGPNGAGKTTTLKLLTGLIHPTAGSATVLGEPAGSVRVKARIGFLPENPYSYDHLTGAEFLDYCGSLGGLPRAVRRDRIRFILDLGGGRGARSPNPRGRRGAGRGLRHCVRGRPPGGSDLDLPVPGLQVWIREKATQGIRKLQARRHRGAPVTTGPTSGGKEGGAN